MRDTQETKNGASQSQLGEKQRYEGSSEIMYHGRTVTAHGVSDDEWLWRVLVEHRCASREEMCDAAQGPAESWSTPASSSQSVCPLQYHQV